LIEDWTSGWERKLQLLSPAFGVFQQNQKLTPRLKSELPYENEKGGQ